MAWEVLTALGVVDVGLGCGRDVENAQLKGAGTSEPPSLAVGEESSDPRDFSLLARLES